MVKFVWFWDYLPHAKFSKNLLRGYTLSGKIYTKDWVVHRRNVVSNTQKLVFK